MTVILTIFTLPSSKIVFYNHVTTVTNVKTAKLCSKVVKSEFRKVFLQYLI